MKEVLEVGFEDDLKDVKDTLGDHKKVLDDHADKIQELQIKNAGFEEKFTSISSQLDRIEKNSLTSNNSLLSSNALMLQTMNKIIEGNTTQNTNKKEVIIKGLTIGGSIVGLLVLGYFALKGVSVSIPIF